jgi:hypothetical protein
MAIVVADASVAGNEHGAGAGERDFEHGVVFRVLDMCRLASWDVDRRRGEEPVDHPFRQTVERERGEEDIRVDTDN